MTAKVALLEAQKSDVAKRNLQEWHTLIESDILWEKHNDSQMPITMSAETRHNMPATFEPICAPI